MPFTETPEGQTNFCPLCEQYAKDIQTMAIKHAAIQGALDQEVQLLKTMCEEMKRERDCAEKKLKEVLAWADKKYQYTEKYKEMSPYFDGYNSSKDELRQILTK